MAAVQFICAKIGMVTGQGLAGVLRKHYSIGILYPVVFALVVANKINAAAAQLKPSYDSTPADQLNDQNDECNEEQNVHKTPKGIT